jgi:hypothetical protein
MRDNKEIVFIKGSKSKDVIQGVIYGGIKDDGPAFEIAQIVIQPVGIMLFGQFMERFQVVQGFCLC